jgi:DNA topoisomerase-2
VYDEETGGMVLKNLTYAPALYKIFDEILVNAADNFQRDSSMTTIKVTIDKEKNLIGVYNDGAGEQIEKKRCDYINLP